MSGFLLDTNHASAILKKLPLRRLPAMAGTVCLSAVGVSELWYMVHNSHQLERNRSDLEGLLARFPTKAFDADVAQTYGRMRAAQRRLGRAISKLDLQIAATAAHFDLIVLTADRDFSMIEGLRTENLLT